MNNKYSGKEGRRLLVNRRLHGMIPLGLIMILILLAFARCGNGPGDPDDEDTTQVVITPGEGMDLYGYIGDSNGNPVENVVVSDGYTCTLTDEDGIYQMKRNSSARFVFYSTPSGYAINTTSETVKMASFYAPLISSVKRYDFTLTQLVADETDFTLICVGDPQTASSSDVTRFKNETMADIKEFTASSSLPCYGLYMGDMVGNMPSLFDQMKVIAGSAAMPAFATIGNHDMVPTSNTEEPRTADAYMKVFGPLNYSFNRGNVHFVCLGNIIYSDSETYTGGFTSSQVTWLVQDLSYVSKDRMVILYYHIPLRASTSIAYRTQILSALNGFAEVHLMCGHTHYTENYIQTSPIAAYEHIHGAACGAWWKSTINGDGTPNGYAIYDVRGNTITNWYYKPTNLEEDFQIRLYRGDVLFGGAYGYFTFDQGENSIVANIWNADGEWSVEAYEDGVKVADLAQLPTTLKDAWALGYHIGVLNRNPDNYTTNCKHLFLHTMVNSGAELEIRATDRFGNVYTQDEITTDFTTAISY